MSPTVKRVMLAPDHRARALLRHLLPPLLAFLLARLALWGAATVAGSDFWDAYVWVRWDSGHYLSIAQEGYRIVPSCAGIEGYQKVGAPDWCGNAAWMPLYPFLLAPFIALGVEQATIGAIVSAAFHLATLVLLWAGFLKSRVTAASLTILAAAAFFPGQVYYHAVFPLSLLTFLALATVYLSLRERWLLAAVTTGLAAATYSPGFLLTPVVAAWLVIAFWGKLPLRKLATRVAVTIAGGASGFLAVLAVQEAQTGMWDAFFKAQEKYKSHPQNTLSSFLRVAREIGGADETLRITAFQTILVAAFVLVLLFAAERSLRARNRLDLFITLYLLAFWLFPLSVVDNGLGLYRHQAMLLPGVILLRHVRPAAAALFLVVFALLAQVIGTAFFTGAIH